MQATNRYNIQEKYTVAVPVNLLNPLSERKVQELKSMMVDAVEQLRATDRYDDGDEGGSGFGRAFDHEDDGLTLNFHNLLTINRYCTRLIDEVK